MKEADWKNYSAIKKYLNAALSYVKERTSLRVESRRTRAEKHSYGPDLDSNQGKFQGLEWKL